MVFLLRAVYVYRGCTTTLWRFYHAVYTAIIKSGQVFGNLILKTIHIGISSLTPDIESRNDDAESDINSVTSQCDSPTLIIHTKKSKVLVLSKFKHILLHLYVQITRARQK